MAAMVFGWSALGWSFASRIVGLGDDAAWSGFRGRGVFGLGVAYSYEKRFLVDQGQVQDAVVHGSSLGDLPEGCVALILSKTSPKDAARLSTVNRVFTQAGGANIIWDGLLPSANLKALGLDDSIFERFPSRKRLFEHLSQHLFITHPFQGHWLDPATGGVCRAVSARAFSVIWGEEHRYWDWVPKQGSSFPDVAFVKVDYWFKIRGQMQCSLPLGAYTLSFRVQLGPEKPIGYFQRRISKCVKFSFAIGGGGMYQLEKAFCLNFSSPNREVNKLQASYAQPRMADNQWLECEVGAFVINEHRKSITLHFNMTEIENCNWKEGLYLDGVVIRPRLRPPAYQPPNMYIPSSPMLGHGTLLT